MHYFSCCYWVLLGFRLSCCSRETRISGTTSAVPLVQPLLCVQFTHLSIYRCMEISNVLVCWAEELFVELQMFSWWWIEEERQSVSRITATLLSLPGTSLLNKTSPFEFYEFQ